MDEWRRLVIPPICERLIGFSVPQDGEVLVISYEGMHIIRLGPAVTVETDDRVAEYDLYDPATGVVRYRNKVYQIIGLHRGHPLLRSLTRLAERVVDCNGDGAGRVEFD